MSNMILGNVYVNSFMFPLFPEFLFFLLSMTTFSTFMKVWNDRFMTSLLVVHYFTLLLSSSLKILWIWFFESALRYSQWLFGYWHSFSTPLCLLGLFETSLEILRTNVTKFWFHRRKLLMVTMDYFQFFVHLLSYYLNSWSYFEYSLGFSRLP